MTKKEFIMFILGFSLGIGMTTAGFLFSIFRII